MGFLWVVAVGSIISLLWRQQQPWERAGQTHPDPELFTPPLANRLRAKFEKSEIQMETSMESMELETDNEKTCNNKDQCTHST